MSASASMSYQALQALVTPLMMKEYNSLYKDRIGEYRQVFSEEDGMERQFHTAAKLYGMGNAVVRAPGDNSTYDQGGLEYMVNFYYQTYGLAFAIPREAIDDGSGYNLLQDFTKHLVWSNEESLEINTVNVFNYGFNSGFLQNGGDGQPLFSNNHPTISAGLQSNTVVTPSVLSQTSLEAMVTQIRSARDSRNKFIQLKPAKLIVPPQLMMTADVLLKSILRSDNANNGTNPLRGMLSEYVVLSRLSSPNAWFILTDGAMGQGLKVFWRERLNRAQEGDFDTNSLRVKCEMRYATGYIDWKACYGNIGAA